MTGVSVRQVEGNAARARAALACGRSFGTITGFVESLRFAAGFAMGRLDRSWVVIEATVGGRHAGGVIVGSWANDRRNRLLLVGISTGPLYVVFVGGVTLMVERVAEHNLWVGVALGTAVIVRAALAGVRAVRRSRMVARGPKRLSQALAAHPDAVGVGILAVRPAYRRTGVGRAMLVEAVKAVEPDVPVLVLAAVEADGLYANAGGQPYIDDRGVLEGVHYWPARTPRP